MTKEIIASYASVAGQAAITVAMVAWLVESVAKDKALTAAFVSPFAVLFVLMAAFSLAEYMGWKP